MRSIRGIRLMSAVASVVSLWVIGVSLLWGVTGAVWAQTDPTAPPDYSIRNIRHELTDENRTVVVLFDVVNNGGAASTSTTARVLSTQGDQIPGAEAAIPPLEQFGVYPVRLTFPVFVFQQFSGERVSLRATVGIGDIERPGSDFIGDNTTRFSVQIPVLPTVPVGTGGAQTVLPPGACDGEIVLNICFDQTTRAIIAAILAGLGILVIVIWIATIILRALFSRPATFSVWQPPYAQSAYLDPNSLAGRRALWQPHAQADTLPMPCQPGTYAARKVLIGAEGGKLKNWRVIGVRLNQYDMYGRVSRSQVIGDAGMVKRLDRAARRSEKLDAPRAERAMRAIGKKLANEFTGKVSRRSASLPVALDVRVDGKHGTVKIVFELHQCVGDGYQQIDSWEPEMVITDRSAGVIHENLTYSLYGQRPTEKMRDFRKRLRAEITRTLANTFAGASPVDKSAKPAKRGKSAADVPAAPTGAPAVPHHASVSGEGDTSMSGDTSPVEVPRDPTPPRRPASDAPHDDMVPE